MAALLLLISNWNLKSLLEALSVFTWISLWNDLVIPLMSVDLELYFLAAEIAQNIIHTQYLGGSGSGCQGSWNQVREGSWEREGISLCSVGYVCELSLILLVLMVVL